MGLENVKRWHWVTIGLVLGYLYAEARMLAGPVDVAALGQSFNDPRTFEKSLAGRTDGVPHFTDLTVYPYSSGRHLVAGRFYNATPRKIERGDKTLWVTGWEDRCFVAANPYRDGLSVYEYLKRTPDASARYAWWADPRWSRLAYTAAGLLVVGVLWPTALNLLRFGQFTRPPDEKVPHLAAPVSTKPLNTSTTPAPTGEDAVIAALEARLAAHLADPNPVASAKPPPTPAQPAKLVGKPIQTVATDQAGRAIDYGAAADDYYPTEVHSPKLPGNTGQVRTGSGGE